MHLDIRYPIGLLLTAYGAILAVQGALARVRVLGVNIDLYWGVFMAVCGLVALYLARRARRATEGTEKTG
jgi:membrane protein implicated in regulation of membrane protease activity